jgi:hypothetical protein
MVRRIACGEGLVDDRAYLLTDSEIEVAENICGKAVDLTILTFAAKRF